MKYYIMVSGVIVGQVIIIASMWWFYYRMFGKTTGSGTFQNVEKIKNAYIRNAKILQASKENKD